MERTIVLGLDGATWDLLDPLAKQGKLPAISHLRSAGRHGPLESITPPVTAPAWLSMATGLNPGKTGVFDFLRRNSATGTVFEPVDASDFAGKSCWEYLEAGGHDVGIYNYPLLYPPPDIDGYAVSGFGAPTEETATTPEGLADELDAITEGPIETVAYAEPKYANRPVALEEALISVIEHRRDAITHLLRSRPTDVFVGVISATDWAQHYFWEAYEEAEDPGETALARIWASVDSLVEEVHAIANEQEAALLIVSDHGFGPAEQTFNITTWLEANDFLKRPKQSIAGRLRAQYFPTLRSVGEWVASSVPTLNDWLEPIGRRLRGDQTETIDFERSKAFAPRQNLGMGMLYLLNDAKSTRMALEQTLADTAEGFDIDLQLMRPEDCYHGPFTALAPEILFVMDGMATVADPRPKTHDRIVTAGPPSRARSGTHRMNGLYLAAGPGIDAENSPESASLLDIAPTVLARHGEDIPTAMDGEVLTELGVSSVPPRRERDLGVATSERSISEDDLDAQLEALGYR